MSDSFEEPPEASGGSDEEYELENEETEVSESPDQPDSKPLSTTAKPKAVRTITPPRMETPNLLNDFLYTDEEISEETKTETSKGEVDEKDVSKAIKTTSKYKGHVELDPIIGKFQSEPPQNYLLGAKCIFCRIIINPAPIVKCLECSYVNPFICIPCFRSGTEGGNHRRSHSYSLFDPKGPPIFNIKSGKRQFGIMEDVALLELLCITNQENWDEKNLVFPDLTYEDALERFEALLMSDIGCYIRENDPLCALRRPLSWETAEKLRINFTPDKIVELKKSIPKAKTRFSDILDTATTLSFKEGPSSRKSSNTKIEPGSPKPGPSHHQTNASKKNQAYNIQQDDADIFFQEVLDNVYEKALKGKTENIKLQKPCDSKESPFNPYKFCAYVRDKSKNDNSPTTPKVIEKEATSSSVKRKSGKKASKRRGKIASRRAKVDDSDDELMEASTNYAAENETPRRSLKHTNNDGYKNPLIEVEKKRIKHARYRKQIREKDTKVKKVVRSRLNSDPEEEEDSDSTETPEPELTAKARAHQRLEKLLETFHIKMGFSENDDWGIEVDNQFSNALDGKDRDYDEASRLHIRQVGAQINDKPILPYKNQLIKKQLKNLNGNLSKKWKTNFQISSSLSPSKKFEDRSSSSEEASCDFTDGFYEVYEPPYQQLGDCEKAKDKTKENGTKDNAKDNSKDNNNTKEMLTEAEFEKITYNQRRHDYDWVNKNDAELILNSVTKRHEPIDFSNMVNMTKINSYQRVLKERSAQASFAREYGLLPIFMKYTENVTYPIGHSPDLDAQFDEAGFGDLKEKYRPLLLPLRQVVTKPMFNEYVHNILRIEELKKQLSDLQERQKSG